MKWNLYSHWAFEWHFNWSGLTKKFGWIGDICCDIHFCIKILPQQAFPSFNNYIIHPISPERLLMVKFSWALFAWMYFFQVRLRSRYFTSSCGIGWTKIFDYGKVPKKQLFVSNTALLITFKWTGIFRVDIATFRMLGEMVLLFFVQFLNSKRNLLARLWCFHIFMFLLAFSFQSF